MEDSGTKKRKTTKVRTRHLSVRVPENILECINLLVELGLFKDRSDFINYSLQETLKKYLLNIKIKVTPELIDKYFVTLERISPRLSEEETLKLLKEIRVSQENQALEEYPY